MPEEVHVLLGHLPAGCGHVASDEPADHLGVAPAHLVDRIHRRVAVEKPPRPALLVEVREVGGDDGVEPRPPRPRALGLTLEPLEESRARPLDACLVQALLGAEVLVEERLGDSARLGDLVHGRGAEAVRAEDPFAGVEHPLLTLPAREPAAGGVRTGGCGTAAHARPSACSVWWCFRW